MKNRFESIGDQIKTFSHEINDSKDVDIVRNLNLLQNSIQSDECSRTTNARTTMNDNWTSFRSNAFSKSSYEASKRLRWIWHSEVRPRCEVEMAKNSLNVTLRTKIFKIKRISMKFQLTHSLHHKLCDDPIRIMTVIKQRDFNVTIVDWHSIHWPVVVTVIKISLTFNSFGAFQTTLTISRDLSRNISLTLLWLSNCFPSTFARSHLELNEVALA